MRFNLILSQFIIKNIILVLLLPLIENLHKVGGSNQRLRQAKNFQNYLGKHRLRISDYQLYQELNICIGSGSVESWIKQIGSRVKIIGARRVASPLGQWNQKNVSQMLRLHCTYLNRHIFLSVST